MDKTSAVIQKDVFWKVNILATHSTFDLNNQASCPFTSPHFSLVYAAQNYIYYTKSSAILWILKERLLLFLAHFAHQDFVIQMVSRNSTSKLGFELIIWLNY